MEKDTGRCVNCGFLGKRRTVVDAESIVYAATTFDRQNGTFNRESGWPDSRDMPTQPACFANVANLQKEFVDALAITGLQGNAIEHECSLVLIEKPRECKSWYPWTEYRSPKEHFEEYKTQQLEQSRRDFETRLFESNQKLTKDYNMVMLRLTVAAIIFAIAQIVAALLALTPDSWIFNR
jgi:hypothetical protein